MPQETSRLYTLLVILSIAVVVLATGYVSMKLSAPAEENLLSVSGSASTFVLPDTASINLGVITQAPTAREASEKNAAASSAVINSLKAAGVQEKDIRTSISIQPLYKYPEGGAPSIVGYSASNNLEITTKMLDRLSDILDGAVASGANQVSGISFSVSEEKQKQVRDELLENAVMDAEEKANKLAESLKVRKIGVKASSISEGAFPLIAAPAVERAATPVLPGESRVTLSVQVTYIIE